MLSAIFRAVNVFPVPQAIISRPRSFFSSPPLLCLALLLMWPFLFFGGFRFAFWFKNFPQIGLSCRSLRLREYMESVGLVMFPRRFFPTFRWC